MDFGEDVSVLVRQGEIWSFLFGEYTWVMHTCLCGPVSALIEKLG